MRVKKRKKKIPWPMICAMPFIPHEPWSHEWEQEVRRLSRKANPLWGKGALMDLYDDGVTAIMEEEMLTN